MRVADLGLVLTQKPSPNVVMAQASFSGSSNSPPQKIVPAYQGPMQLRVIAEVQKSQDTSPTKKSIARAVDDLTVLHFAERVHDAIGGVAAAACLLGPQAVSFERDQPRASASNFAAIDGVVVCPQGRLIDLIGVRQPLVVNLRRLGPLLRRATDDGQFVSRIGAFSVAPADA